MPGGVQWSCNKKRGMCHCNKIETTVPKNHSSMLSSLGSASYCMRRSSWGKDMPASCHSGRSQKLRNRAAHRRRIVLSSCPAPPRILTTASGVGLDSQLFVQPITRAASQLLALVLQLEFLLHGVLCHFNRCPAHECLKSTWLTWTE
ncbi:uncharacterized protein Dana_GF27884 [Drosophila ananassae]|uniref:Uncharacterized protein n=1 Tax=Drosophila ananassae TaxID=7217 RepID=A0A0P8XSW4_DROAN|nr:uncharacterized protein Dana_GF27884 [Drosophila ananassae]